MVILVYPYGRHSNRLFQNLHIEAFCIENHIPFFNATLYGMARLFAFPSKYLLAICIYFLFRLVKLLRLTRLRLLPFMDFTEKSNQKVYEEFLLHGRENIVFVGGWEFRVHELVLKHANYLRNKYSINRTDANFNSLEKKLKEYEIIIGIHIRRKDYRQWQGGKYAYDDASYNHFIEAMVKFFPGKKIIVLYFSDEILKSSNLYQSVDTIVSKNKYYIDYQLMGKCNYLLGPPSTFTTWASFLYRIPYLHIENSQQEIRLEDFRICNQG
jgi:hypothetical protein